MKNLVKIKIKSSKSSEGDTHLMPAYRDTTLNDNSITKDSEKVNKIKKLGVQRTLSAISKMPTLIQAPIQYKVIVAFTSNNEMLLYDIVDFTSANFKIKNEDVLTEHSQEAKFGRRHTSSDTRIAQNDSSVNTGFMHDSQNNTDIKKSLKAEKAEKTPDLGGDRAVFADGVTKSDSIERTTDNRMVVVVKDDIVKASSNDSELIKKVRKALARFPKVPVKKQVINVGRKAKKETVYSEYTKYIRKNDVQKYNDKMNLLNHPYELVYATTNYINEAPRHKRKDNIVDFARGSVLMMVGNRKYAADVVVAVTRTGKCELYDVVGLDDF